MEFKLHFEYTFQYYKKGELIETTNRMKLTLNAEHTIERDGKIYPLINSKPKIAIYDKSNSRFRKQVYINNSYFCSVPASTPDEERKLLNQIELLYRCLDENTTKLYINQWLKKRC